MRYSLSYTATAVGFHVRSRSGSEFCASLPIILRPRVGIDPQLLWRGNSATIIGALFPRLLLVLGWRQRIGGQGLERLDTTLDLSYTWAQGIVLLLKKAASTARVLIK